MKGLKIMKKISVILLALVLVCSFSLFACSDEKAEGIIGVWKTENVGYYTITTFLEDGSFNSVYTVSDPETVEAYGITQEMLDSMNNQSYYKFVSASELSEEETAEAKGRFVIKIYATREDMDADQGGTCSYYTLEKDTLVLDGCVYNRYEK